MKTAVKKTSSLQTNFPATLWYQTNWLSCLLLPFSWIYCLIIYIRRTLYRLDIFHSYKSPIPIIIVGNITVGGTGKTPLVIALAKLLASKNFHPAVITRGYKAKYTTNLIEISKKNTVEEIGDEAFLLAKHLHCPIIVSKDRVLAAKTLLKKHKCDVIISDDGLQHYALDRHIEIAVIDGERRLGNGFLLPAGPLRESTSRLKEVDFIVSNGKAKNNEFSMSLEPQNLPNLSKQTVHAVAGIGNPDRFFSTLRKLGFSVIPHAFPDHHWFSAKDLDFGDEKPILMTEKDDVKCQNLPKNIAKKCFTVPVEAKLEDRFIELLLEKLRKLHNV
ncbi:MAG: tetraacyldisaccharide 4'-kinase [Gammaproteobacteria bacterium]